MRDELWFPQVIWNSTIDDLDNDNLKSYVYQKVEEEKINPPLGKKNQPRHSVDIIIEENNEVKNLIDRLNE